MYLLDSLSLEHISKASSEQTSLPLNLNMNKHVFFNDVLQQSILCGWLSVLRKIGKA